MHNLGYTYTKDRVRAREREMRERNRHTQRHNLWTINGSGGFRPLDWGNIFQ